MAQSTGSLYFEAGINLSRLETDVKKMEARLSAAEGNINKSGEKSGKGFSSGFAKYMSPQFLGLTALTAVVGKLANDSVSFSKDFNAGMTEVATISQTVTDNFKEFSKEVIGVSLMPIKDDAVELSKAYYQIVSAGHDGAAGIKVLEAAAKAATGGVTETAIAADGLTTVMNAWGESSENVNAISDKMFTTVRLGKTTFGELSASIAQVAPIAASSGIAMDQIFAAVASLTKQGTPTAQAMTQIRASIIAMTKVLGDGWSSSMTYQEGLSKIAEMSGGSQNELRKLIPEIEGMNAVLGMTGDKAIGAAADLEALTNSTGAAEAAFTKMSQTRDIQAQNFKNNLMASMSGFGDMVNESVTGIFKEMNEAFANGSIGEFFEDVAKAIKVAAAVMVVYNASTIATTISMAAQELALKALIVQEQVLIRWNKLSAASQAAYNIAGKGTAGVMNVIGVAAKSLWATMAANPLTAIIAVVGLAAAAYFAFRTKVKDAAAVQEDFNRLQEDSKKVEGTSEMIARYKLLAKEQSLTNDEQKEYNDLIEQLSKKYPDAIGQIDEHGKILSLNTGKLKDYNEQQKAAIGLVADQQLKDAEKSLDKYTKKLNEAQAKTAETYTITYGDQYGGSQTLEKTRTGKQRAKAAGEVLEYSDEVAKIQETIAELRKTLGLDISVETAIEVPVKKGSEIEVPVVPVIPPRTIKRLEEELKDLESKVGTIGDPKKEGDLQRQIIDKGKEIEAEWLKVREAMYGKQEELVKMEAKKTDEIKVQNTLVKQGLAPVKTLTEEERKQLEIIKKKHDQQTLQNEQVEGLINGLYDAEQIIGAMSGVAALVSEEFAEQVEMTAYMAGSAGTLIGHLSSGNWVGAITTGLDMILTIYNDIKTSNELSADLQREINEQAIELNNVLKDRIQLLVAGGIIAPIEGVNAELRLLKENLNSATNQLDTFYHHYFDNGVKYTISIGDMLDTVYGENWTPFDLENAISDLDAFEKKFLEMTGSTKYAYYDLSELSFLDKDTFNATINDIFQINSEIESLKKNVSNIILGFSEGDLASSVVNGITQGFQLAENGLGGFADSFQDLLQKAALQAMTATFESKYMQSLMENFSTDLGDGVLTDTEKIDLETQYKEAVEGMQVYFQSWEELFGDMGESAREEGMKGAIKGVTEQTAGLLEGRMNSIQYTIIESKKVIDSQLMTLQEIRNNTSYNRHLRDIAEDVYTTAKEIRLLRDDLAKQETNPTFVL